MRVIKSTRSKKQLITAGLLSTSFVALAIAMSSIIMPGSTSPVPVAAKATSSTSGGGGITKPALPADWPASVPTPAGKIFGSSSTIGLWSVGITVQGDYATTMNDLRPLYTNAGFTDLNPSDQVPFEFQNDAYTIQVVGSNHDHSASATDVTVHLIKR